MNSEAITAYERALDLEPTWDLGWINLATLQTREDDLEAAMASLDRARHINPFTSAPFQWARLVESSGSDVDADLR